jgi:hypothetical protein
MNWEDKLYSVYEDRVFIFYLSLPFLLFLYYVRKPVRGNSFGYLWLSEEKRMFMQQCGNFDIVKDVCAKYGKPCLVAFNNKNIQECS